MLKDKSNAILVEDWAVPLGFKSLKFPEFIDNRHIQMARLSDVRTGQLYPFLEVEPTPGV
jgi:hypothetical protein